MTKNRSKNFKIKSGAEIQPKPVNAANSSPGIDDERVSVSLRHYQRSYECFSKWTKVELKTFSKWLDKMAERTVTQVTSTTKTGHAHIGTPKKLPQAISHDVLMYGLDVGDKPRVHGFFIGSGFYLVWLDREHKILK